MVAAEGRYRGRGGDDHPGVLIFLLTAQSRFFGSEFHLRTYMEDSAGMTANAPVRLNGILVGHIDKITLSGSHDPSGRWRSIW